MRFLKRDVNTSLIVLIIFFLVLFIGFTIYYETTLRDILHVKSQTEEQLNQMTAELVFDKFNTSDNLKKLALMDKAVLEQKYNELEIQNKQLKDEKSDLQQEITLLNSEIEYQKVKIDGPVEQFRRIQDKNELIRQLKEKIDSICLYLKQNNISVDGCK